MLKEALHPSGKTICFDEIVHRYSVKENPEISFISGTQFLHKFFPKFDKEKISLRYATKHDMSQSEVLAMWEEKGRVARENGTEVHNFMEEIYYEKSPEFSHDNEKVRKIEMVGLLAWEALSDKYYLIGAEEILASIDLKICGMTDLIGVNKITGALVILDWKTNAVLKYDNPFQSGFKPIQNYQDCNFNHYILQLNLYEYIAKYEGYFPEYDKYERALVHITDKNFKIIDVPEKQKDISNMINTYQMMTTSIKGDI